MMQRDISFVKSMFVILKLPIFRRRSRRHDDGEAMMNIDGAIIIYKEPLFSNDRNIYLHTNTA